MCYRSTHVARIEMKEERGVQLPGWHATKALKQPGCCTLCSLPKLLSLPRTKGSWRMKIMPFCPSRRAAKTWHEFLQSSKRLLPIYQRQASHLKCWCVPVFTAIFIICNCIYRNLDTAAVAAQGIKGNITSMYYPRPGT